VVVVCSKVKGGFFFSSDNISFIEKSGMHTRLFWIEIWDLSHVKRGVYFDVSLILNKDRRVLIMLISVYLFSALGMCTYMRYVSPFIR
jgi:hypothetical protein